LAAWADAGAALESLGVVSLPPQPAATAMIAAALIPIRYFLIGDCPLCLCSVWSTEGA
jgi:hypothetical protein